MLCCQSAIHPNMMESGEMCDGRFCILSKTEIRGEIWNPRGISFWVVWHGIIFRQNRRRKSKKSELDFKIRNPIPTSPEIRHHKDWPKRQIRNSLQRNFLSQKNFSLSKDVFRPPKVIFCCVGSFFSGECSQTGKKVPLGTKNLLRERNSLERANLFWENFSDLTFSYDFNNTEYARFQKLNYIFNF